MAAQLSPRRGIFITFEGGEGVGKTTQIHRIAQRLRDIGADVAETREPGGPPEGEAVRGLLKNLDLSWSPLSETLLNCAARAEHVSRLIAPALAAGRWVLCDRFFDSTVAYQGLVGAVDRALIDRLNAAVMQSTVPDVTVLLDLDPKQSFDRVRGRGPADDKYDAKDLSFHERLRAAYLSLAQAAPDRFAVVDAAHPEDAVEAAIWSVLVERGLVS